MEYLVFIGYTGFVIVVSYLLYRFAFWFIGYGIIED